MAAPVGAEVRIYYDGGELAPGQALMTPTGRLYLIVAARQQARGKHRGRWHLRCLVADRDSYRGGYVHPLHWYPRGRRRSENT